MLVSVHIPKCAGTSFRHILRDIYGESLWLNYGAIFVHSQAHATLNPPGTRCIHGHFFADAFDHVVSDCELITWLRDPVERVVSNYHHFLRSPDMRDDCCRALHERRLSLLQFAELDWMRNEATRYLAGKPLDAFAFVGIAERFEESLQRLGHRFSWSGQVLARRDNTNPARLTDRYELTTAERECIAALNADDQVMYDRAVAALDGELDRVASGQR